MWLELEKIRALAELAAEKNLAELTLSEDGKQITIKLPQAQVVQVATPQFPSPVATPAAMLSSVPANAKQSSEAPIQTSEATSPPSLNETRTKCVKSPMVATFYAAASPESPPFVAVGQSVTAGQTLCILEAMKQMNELESDVTGKVVAVLAQNGQPVEYGQPLFEIEPA
ncbi:MAG: acetyl-CoA carboxylase biotin carboxyl carrier protein [Vampirovibrionales bacterium]|nr:acetyl-CoA carboxylase biotin carboxyl carrier protein [Vampirovibrionales bacterium]